MTCGAEFLYLLCAEATGKYDEAVALELGFDVLLWLFGNGAHLIRQMLLVCLDIVFFYISPQPSPMFMGIWRCRLRGRDGRDGRENDCESFVYIYIYI